MGIPKLNRYLSDTCSDKSIKKIHLSLLKDKIIVIDVSIYLYKFACYGDLMEQMYLFISILRYYNIKPIFIFDGKPPPEKKELLMKRYYEKKEAEKEYKKLQIEMNNEIIDSSERKRLEDQINILKKKSIRISDLQIKNVKELMEAYGVQYFDAKQEADQLCGYLSTKNECYGCLSDDMDMFMYNCDYVIRHLSLLNHTVVLYDCKEIRNDLKISIEDLRTVLLTVGGDYNLDSKYTINKSFELYRNFKDQSNIESYQDFIKEKDKDINLEKINKLRKILDYVDDEGEELKMKNKLGLVNENKLKEILEPHGFYWV